MYFPEIVAGKNCDVLCSGETTLFQHCGLANCVDVGRSASHGCHEIPEFILHTHRIAMMLKGSYKEISSCFHTSRTRYV